MMQLSLAGGGIMSAYHPTESNLERLVRQLKNIVKWIKDILNQKLHARRKGIPEEMQDERLHDETTTATGNPPFTVLDNCSAPLLHAGSERQP